MPKPRDASSQEFAQARETLGELGTHSDTPNLNGPGSRKLEAWFLGPKAENAAEFERLILDAIRDHT